VDNNVFEFSSSLMIMMILTVVKQQLGQRQRQLCNLHKLESLFHARNNNKNSSSSSSSNKTTTTTAAAATVAVRLQEPV
jgi:hypothetical protein